MKKHTFDLIIATLGRLEEVDKILNSLAHQDYDLSLVHIWIVDQNDKIDLKPVIAKYSSILDIHHLMSDRKGLAYNRNIALKDRKSDIIAFPDDDCEYYPDTLSSVNNLANQYDQIDCFLGRIIDRKTGENIIRNWGRKERKITESNFYRNYSSITIFLRNLSKYPIRFCDQLGSGQYFGSCEDTDFLIQLLRHNCKILYTPTIEVWHPAQKIVQFNESKAWHYGLGFGAFCKKNSCKTLMFEAIVYHSIFYVLSFFSGNPNDRKIRMNSIKSRIQGWKEWNN